MQTHDTGGFEFVPALEYPESEDGAQRREEPQDLPSTGSAVDAFSDSGMPGKPNKGAPAAVPSTGI